MDAMLENKPMTLQDEPNERDFCGIEQYYTGLSNFIKQCQPPLTISIQGDWGTGKTSMMHRIAMNLEEEGYAAIWFDSWRFVQFGEADQLPAILINQLASEMVKLSEKASSRENESGSDTGSDAPAVPVPDLPENLLLLLQTYNRRDMLSGSIQSLRQ